MPHAIGKGPARPGIGLFPLRHRAIGEAQGKAAVAARRPGNQPARGTFERVDEGLGIPGDRPVTGMGEIIGVEEHDMGNIGRNHQSLRKSRHEISSPENVMNETTAAYGLQGRGYRLMASILMKVFWGGGSPALTPFMRGCAERILAQLDAEEPFYFSIVVPRALTSAMRPGGCWRNLRRGGTDGFASLAG